MADFGAEVIKIENPLSPDDSRNFPPLKDGSSGYFEILNRNKKGVSLDLKNEQDLNKFYNLCKDADVIVENLTPSTKTKLKISYLEIIKINPKIIYASLAGVGQDVDKKYYDIIAQAESGLMSLSGPPNFPTKIGPSIVDAFSGTTLAFGIASALFYRERTGQGIELDVSMLGVSMNLLESSLIEYSITKIVPTGAGNQDNTISPFGIYKTRDGYVTVACGNDNLWEKLEEFLGEYILFSKDIFSTNQKRLENNQKLTKTIESVFAKFNTDQILEKLLELQIPSSPVNTMKEVSEHKYLFEKQYLEKINHPQLGECIVPGKSVNFKNQTFQITPAPKIGEHNSEYGI